MGYNESLLLIGYVNLADLLRNRDKKSKNLHQINASVYATDDQEVVAKLAFKYELIRNSCNRF
ncbi:CBS domain-containing protein [Peptoniphilus harei]|uniref:hypothetical protein n=1 Tax=Peptoniphilus harei TaxID=54005 RepID=UPI002ADD8509|nr:hypothetical protein [Peptoniphilus harei]